MLGALAFLTVVGPARPPSRNSLVWFPVVGAGLGAALGGAWWGAQQVWPPVVAAILVVVADLALTGLLHVDGLADSADGLLPPLERERRLEIMKDPHPGAFGVTAVVTVLLARWAALAALVATPLLLVALWTASRAGMAAATGLAPYARSGGGLASRFHGAPWAPWVGLAVLPAAAVAVAAIGVEGAVSVAAGVLAGGLVLALARRRLGGYTGDVLGAGGLAIETVGLIVAAAAW